MGFMKDNLLPFMRKRDLPFVERHEESAGVYTFRFEKPDDLKWQAGQYGLFTITHSKVKNATRPFSLSSAPVENVVQFTTYAREPKSEFKQALFELKPGMTINMRGPVGPFYLKDNGPALFIAGGIGITPFRSILKQCLAESEQNGNDTTMQLLYVDDNKAHLFQDELNEWASQLQMDVNVVHSKEELYPFIQTFAAKHRDRARYYTAGPKSMVDEVAQYVYSQQIPKRNIIKDRFFGY